MRNSNVFGILSIAVLFMGVLAMPINMSAFAQADADPTTEDVAVNNNNVDATDVDATPRMHDTIKTDADCLAADGEVMEIDPPQCMLADGMVYDIKSTTRSDDTHGHDSADDKREKLDGLCALDGSARTAKIAEYYSDDTSEHVTKITAYCALTNDTARDAYIQEHYGDSHGHMEEAMHDTTKEKLDSLCELTGSDRTAKIAEHHSDDIDGYTEKVTAYCALTDDTARDTFLMEHRGESKSMRGDSHDNMKGMMSDKYSPREKLDGLCALDGSDRTAKIAEHHGDDISEHVTKVNAYCALTDDAERDAYIQQHYADSHGHMEGMKDNYNPREKLDGLCALDDAARDAKIAEHHSDDIDAHTAKVNAYCALTDNTERDAYIQQHYGDSKSMRGDSSDKMMREDSMTTKHDTDSMKYGDKATKGEMKMHLSDAKKDELRMKFKSAHSDLSDEQRDELRMEIKSKFSEHKMKYEKKFNALSEDKKQQIRDKITQLKENPDASSYKMHSSTSPLKQIMTGLTIDEIECKNGQLLVLKVHSGIPLCLSESTADKLIEREIVAPVI